MRSLAGFAGTGYDRGRSRAHQIAWYAVQNLVFAKWWLPARLRPRLLRAFGATVGTGVLIRNGVRVHWPWKLTIGDDSWIGEDAWILNLEPVAIGHDVCVSQEALLCTGSHDRDSPTFEFDNAPDRPGRRRVGGGSGQRCCAGSTSVGRRLSPPGVVAYEDVPSGAVLLA